MKTKLLKKVRRRFRIIHMPKGYIDSCGGHYNYNLFKLEDSDDTYGYNTVYAQLGKRENGRPFCDDIFETKEECINYLKFRLINRLRIEGHKQRKDKIIEKAQVKVWHI